VKLAVFAAIPALLIAMPAFAQAEADHSAHHEAAPPATPSQSNPAMPGMAQPQAAPGTGKQEMADCKCPCCEMMQQMMQQMMQMMQQHGQQGMQSGQSHGPADHR
jgi:hypothetical protein